MKAARYTRFGSPDVLEVVDLPDPHPGPGQIRVAVHAAGINPTDCKARQGLLGGTVPATTGREVAGVVDELSDGITDVAVGDRVFGFSDDPDGAGAAELALVRHYALIPDTLSFAQVAGLPVVAETATRALRALGIGIRTHLTDSTNASADGTAGTDGDGDGGADAGAGGRTLIISGASGGIGATAVQLAVAAGVEVIGTASPGKHEYVRRLGAQPIAYGPGLTDRVLNLAPQGVDLALDVAGSGILPELIELTGSPQSVVTLADFPGAKRYGVHFSTGEDGRALDILPTVAHLMTEGRFVLPIEEIFSLTEIGHAHRLIEDGHSTGKVILAIAPLGAGSV